MSDGSVPNTSAAAAPQLDGEVDESCVVRDPREVRRLLQALVDQRVLVSAQIEGSGHAFPTTVLELGDGADWLLLDAGPNEAVNRIAGRSGQLWCSAQLERVGVRFHLARCEAVSHDGHPAFQAAFPATFQHLQRRQLYRLEAPLTDSPVCVLPGNEEGDTPLELRVLDISGGGLALALPMDQSRVVPNATYPGCELRLPGVAPIEVELNVRNMFTQTMANGTEVLRAGMRFGKLPRAAENKIQRYIFSVERKRSAQSRGAR